jgi:hypothetical protein
MNLSRGREKRSPAGGGGRSLHDYSEKEPASGAVDGGWAPVAGVLAGGWAMAASTRPSQPGPQAALWTHGPRRWQPAGPASAWAAATTGTQHGRGRATSCRELTAGRGGQLLAGEGDITRVERARAAVDRRRHVSVAGQGASMEEPE